MKFYVTATILALTVGAMSAAVPDSLSEALNVAIREAAASPDTAAAAECMPLLQSCNQNSQCCSMVCLLGLCL